MAATNITISIDNSLLPTAVNALAWKGGYVATLPNGTTNPMTKNTFAKQQIINYTMNAIADYQAMTAQQAVVPPASNLIS